MLERTLLDSKSFDFDWNNYKTIPSDITKIEAAKSLVDSPQPTDDKAREQYGETCYRLGTFYNHIKRTPAPALECLQRAEKIVTHEKLAWTQNHIAFSYQQQFMDCKKTDDQKGAEKNKKLALEYCTQVIEKQAKETSIESIKITTFAYCVRALTEYEDKKLDAAIKSYRFALDLYEKNNLLDDQYARAKNRYAMMLAENNNTREAGLTFAELEKYWSEKNDLQNPYPARFYVCCADYFYKLQPANFALALEKYKKAHAILCETEGEKAKFTQDIQKKIIDIEHHLLLSVPGVKISDSLSHTTLHRTQEQTKEDKNEPLNKRQRTDRPPSPVVSAR